MLRINRTVSKCILFNRKTSLFTNLYSERPKYSSNNDEDDFYHWVEKMVVPFPIMVDDYRAKELRKILYEALNSPPDQYYSFNEL